MGSLFNMTLKPDEELKYAAVYLRCNPDYPETWPAQTWTLAKMLRRGDWREANRYAVQVSDHRRQTAFEDEEAVKAMACAIAAKRLNGRRYIGETAEEAARTAFVALREAGYSVIK